jgi:tetratricopeptide (TPR) repeat protein
MSTSPTQHFWAMTASAVPTGGNEPGNPPSPHLEVRCHRRLGGPYTGGGALLRLVLPDLLGSNAELISAHATEILALAPDLAQGVTGAPQTLTNTAEPAERTRFYGVGRTVRLAHGVAELLIGWARARHPDGVVISFHEVDHADATDIELLGVLLRRCDPRLLTIVVHSDDATENSPLGQALIAFARTATRHAGPRMTQPAGADLARLFIDSDGTSDDPAVRAAYASLASDERARLHTDRADHLATLDNPGTRLGAIPYHCEHGVDPAGAGGNAIRAALGHCFEFGYYHAALDLALRGRRIVSREEQPKLYWGFSVRVAAAMSYLARGEEAVPYLAEFRRYTTDPQLHMKCSYLMAMLYTRHLEPNAHDEDLALEWVNSAIVIADSLPDPKERAFQGAFMRNARALVELHRRNLEGALSMVNEAIKLTDASLGADEQRLHRSVLRHNRAQVLAALGDPAGALEDYGDVIRRDPEYADYYFDRAGAHRAVGNDADALADFAEAIRLSPPFPEAYYNRADLLREVGDDEAALRDFDYVLELDPDHIDALINRAGIHLARGNHKLARSDLEHGMRLEPRNANVLSAYGSLLAESGDTTGAEEYYNSALKQDPKLVEAWANRAVLFYSTGRTAEAIDDLDEAILLSDATTLRVNRAIALQDVGEHRGAVEDLTIALADATTDPTELLYLRGVSRYNLNDSSGALADWEAHFRVCGGYDNSPHTEEIQRLTVTKQESGVSLSASMA